MTKFQSVLGFPQFFPLITSESAGMAVNNLNEDWMSDLNFKFIPSEWIGKGKTFGDAPLYVDRALLNSTAIPSNWKLRKPAPDLPVSAFLQQRYPEQSKAKFIAHKPAKCFYKEVPDTNIDFIITRPIPPREWIDKLCCRSFVWTPPISNLHDASTRHCRSIRTHVHLDWRVLSGMRDGATRRRTQATQLMLRS